MPDENEQPFSDDFLDRTIDNYRPGMQGQVASDLRRSNDKTFQRKEWADVLKKRDCISLAEYARRAGKSLQHIWLLARQGRIEGAVQPLGYGPWLVPVGAAILPPASRRGFSNVRPHHTWDGFYEPDELSDPPDDS